MPFFQAGLEITRLPPETNMWTPMFGNMMDNNNNMANIDDSAAGIRVGIGSSIFQIASSVISDRFAMVCMLTGAYFVTTTMFAGLFVDRLAARPYPTVVFMGKAVVLVVILAFVVFLTFSTLMLPKLLNDSQSL